MEDLRLSPVEARVLAALVEKSITTPKYYPMSVNAVMLAANQKNCRSPVMTLSEGETGAALNHLESLELCRRDDRSGRVVKWRHDLRNFLLLKSDALAVLVTLMLRGPQTLSELRANAAGLGGPSDVAATDAVLNDLTDRAQPLVTQMPRAPGRKETRYAHTLCGDQPVEESGPAPATASRTPGRSLEERLAALEARVEQLERARDPTSSAP